MKVMLWNSYLTSKKLFTQKVFTVYWVARLPLFHYLGLVEAISHRHL